MGTPQNTPVLKVVPSEKSHGIIGNKFNIICLRHVSKYVCKAYCSQFTILKLSGMDWNGMQYSCFGIGIGMRTSRSRMSE
jgi:hypothetical protein